MTTDTDYAAYLRWWENEGSGMPPLAKEDAEEHVRRVTQAAWMSAVHCASAALAQPEPVGVTDEELLGCMLKAAASVPSGQCTGILDWDKEAIAAARAVLARWGRPAIKPVPVSERLPGPKDCDAEGRCWVLGKVESDWRLISMINPGVPKLSYCFSHWLPHWALPLPPSDHH